MRAVRPRCGPAWSPGARRRPGRRGSGSRRSARRCAGPGRSGRPGAAAGAGASAPPCRASRPSPSRRRARGPLRRDAPTPGATAGRGTAGRRCGASQVSSRPRSCSTSRTEPKSSISEVAQAAVDQLAAARGRPGAEVTLLKQAGGELTGHGVSAVPVPTTPPPTTRTSSSAAAIASRSVLAGLRAECGGQSGLRCCGEGVPVRLGLSGRWLRHGLPRNHETLIGPDHGLHPVPGKAWPGSAPRASSPSSRSPPGAPPARRWTARGRSARGPRAPGR